MVAGLIACQLVFLLGPALGLLRFLHLLEEIVAESFLLLRGSLLDIVIRNEEVGVLIYILRIVIII